MRIAVLNAIFFIAIIATSTGVSAQNVYKCGDAYSQLPCPGGVTIDTADPRTSTQKTQADLATARDARSADAMESARLRQEKADLAANAPPRAAASAAKSSKPQAKRAMKKMKRLPASFTKPAAGANKKTQHSPQNKSVKAKDDSTP